MHWAKRLFHHEVEVQKGDVCLSQTQLCESSKKKVGSPTMVTIFSNLDLVLLVEQVFLDTYAMSTPNREIK